MLWFLLGCKFAHIKIPQEEFAYASPCNILYRPNEGFEGLLAQKDNLKVVSIPSSRGNDDLTNKIGFGSYKVSRSIYIIVFNPVAFFL